MIHRVSLSFAAVLLLAAQLPAQLTTEQRVFDFQNLAALYAKRYAPLDWKKRALGFDAMDLKPWLERVRNAKDDLEFFEIQAEYVARFQDTHAHFTMTSSFVANLGITVDIYEGKVLLDGINRTALPAVDFPFQIGDELLSMDGEPVEDLIARFGKLYAYGNPESTRRLNAARLTVRAQSTVPRAVELGDSAEVVVRRASGDLETYTLAWTKSGTPVRKVGPVPVPRAAAQSRAADGEPEYMRGLNEFRNWKIGDNDSIMQPLGWGSDPDGGPRKYVIGIGSRNPIFRAGLPASFTVRLGNAAADFHFSGTYRAGGKTIGYLRIPSFTPTLAQAIRELDTEIEFFQRNTDGLVVDVMRNPGGGCYMLDLAARMIPHPFYFFGEEVRVTQDRLNSIEAQLNIARVNRAPEWVIITYEYFAGRMREALESNRGMTEPIPSCTQSGSNWAPVTEGNLPVQNVYTKPMIVLVDAFSISAADIFPSMLQDNGRGVLVGMRTSGGGGSVSGWPTGFYSESFSTNTNSLVVRRAPITTEDLPAAPYVENIGARPDIPLDYMTRENLLNNGRTFVNAFTDILLGLIEGANP